MKVKSPLIKRLPNMLATGAFMAVAAMVAGHASAKTSTDWSSGPITFIVPFSPGGGGDTLARLYAKQLTQTMDTNFIVENRPGAGGNIGTAAAARAKPNGETIVFGTAGTMGTNHALYKKPGFSIDDFEPVALFGTTSLAMVVNKDSKFQKVGDVIDYAKKHPKELTCASGGNGTISHLACVTFQQMAGIEIEHIPYKGTSTALIDIQSGRLSFIIDVAPPLMPHINNGSVRALAVTSAKRIPALPDAPTMSEAGLTGYDVFTWDGIFAPKGTPAERLDILHAGVEKAINDPDFRKAMAERGTILEPISRKAFGDLVKKEYVRMGSLAKSLGVTID